MNRGRQPGKLKEKVKKGGGRVEVENGGKGGHMETSIPLLIVIESKEDTRAPEDEAQEREREGD